MASIAVASVGEAAVALDSRGDPTGDIIAWFDGRARPQAGRLGRAVGQERLFGLTGLSLQPIFGLCKLLWLRENEPEAYSRTATWLNVADFMAFRLCGVAATDFSLASRTLALDLHNLRWSDEVLEEVGVPPDLFAPLRESGSALGTVTREAAEPTRLPEGACVAAGGHDHACGALAVGVSETGTMLNSLGTAEAIFLPSSARSRTPGSATGATLRAPTWPVSTTSSAASTPRAQASNGCARSWTEWTTTP